MQAERLAAALPLPQLHLPFVFDGDIGRRQIEALATALGAAIDRCVAIEQRLQEVRVPAQMPWQEAGLDSLAYVERVDPGMAAAISAKNVTNPAGTTKRAM